MSHKPPLEEIAAATRRFVRSLAPQRPHRVEATVASTAGMPVLCAVEAALAESLPARAGQELVWLTSGPSAGVHRIRLLAYGPGDKLLAEAAHEFAA
jgi:fumarate hydratase class II